jgi:DNA-directed RNA polymerase specialized sigma24 family protein
VLLHGATARSREQGFLHPTRTEVALLHLAPIAAYAAAIREILVLREIEELSYHQISDITALPIGTVMSRLARARKAFADAWDREAATSG